MWKVKHLEVMEPMSMLSTALTYADGSYKYELTNEELAAIKTLYGKYNDLKGIAHDDLKGVDFSKPTRNAIYTAYSEVQVKGRLKEVRSKLLLNAGRCPVCGILESDELDHHLPRSVFKLLSVYSWNLVPICHKCNNKKRALTGEDEERRFSHAYFCDPPNSRFFLAKSVFENNGLETKFYVDQGAGLDDSLFALFSYQIERVNLDARLKRETNTLLSTLAVAIDMMYGQHQSADAVSDFLNKTARQFDLDFGINDWRTAFIDSLVGLQQFCDGGYRSILFPSPQHA